MAYAALVSLTQLLEQILHHDRFFCSSSSDEEQKLKSLQEKVTFLLAFLDDQSHRVGDTLRFLEVLIRDAAYHAQYTIETIIADQIRSDYESNRGVRLLVSTIQKVKGRRIRNMYGENLVKAVEKIDSVVTEAINVRISCKVEEMQITHASTSSATNGGTEMVGFDEELIEIKERLCGESSRLRIIPIVGMGGIGKTTLARNVFDDSLIAYHFHSRAWITISQEYNVREILLALLDSLTLCIEDSSKITNEELMEKAYKCLKGRTYLIIMDDMWSANAWDDLRRIFSDDNNGSRIVITTRLTNVAEYVSSSPIHQMQFLNEDQSWNLLRKNVFVEQSCPPELEEIGRIIAKNCGGLPLAIVVVAGILIKIDRIRDHWKYIAENISSSMANSDEHYSNILTLSYNHLPNHLKACFLYFGFFPEDYEIPVSKLIMLWVAEGFLKPLRSKSLEEVAEEYLEDLVKRNLVLISKTRSNGKFRLCYMHDLLRDLCIPKGQEEKISCVIHRRTHNFMSDIAHHRRLGIHRYLNVESMISNVSISHIRSMLNFVDDPKLFSVMMRVRLLRVLDSPKTELYFFPVEIGELFHLRYLSFAYCNPMGEQLMIALSKLQNLQTLIIHSDSYLTSSLPLQIWKFPQIRHLIMCTTILRIPWAKRIGGHFLVLENLRTLRGVVNFKLTSTTLAMIPNLKKLKVLYTGLSRAKWSKLRLDNLVHMRQLESLNLAVNYGRGQNPFPTSYALPSNLKKLTLKRFKPPLNDMTIIGSLPNLEVLKLKSFDFEGGEWECREGDFRKLKFLLIERSSIVHWRAENTHFPCLEHLIVRYCLRLEIPCAIGDITSLRLIDVGPESTAADSALVIQEEQQSLGNDILQVRFFY